MTQNVSPWRKVTLYGVNHSPWVQGVRMALAHHGIPTRLTSYPISVSWFFRRGFVFPSLRCADGTIHTDSFEIYRLLESEGYALGFDTLSADERVAFQAELEALFGVYALGRCVRGKRWRFIRGWSTMQESPPSASGIVWRALLSLYFWMLIRLGIRIAEKKGRTPYDLETIERGLEALNERLTGTTWLSGEGPGCLDFALMGHIQCMTSGLTDELLPLLDKQDALMRWIERMMRALEGYSPRYADRLLNTSEALWEAPRIERALFWMSWTLWLIAWPLSLSLFGISLAKRSTNPAHSGAVLRRYRRGRTKP